LNFLKKENYLILILKKRIFLKYFIKFNFYHKLRKEKKIVELLFVNQSTIDKHLKLSYQNKHDSRQFLADALRLNTLSMIMQAGSGHIGSSFSAMDLVLGIYLDLVLPEGKTNLKAKYISSKGHDAPGLYSILVAFGILDEKNQMKLRRIDGLPGHPDISTPGIYANTGSLGMGISKAKGFIEANRIRHIDEPVIVLTGDGELQEGQTWEALMFAAHHKLPLRVVVDRNGLQALGSTESINSLEPLEAKFKAFGWNTKVCDGHNVRKLKRALKGKTPLIVIANTIKGKGVPFMENNVNWHYRNLDEQGYSEAILSMDIEKGS
jgi:transketolase